MTSVSIWIFPSPDGADHARRTLERLRVDRLVLVQDAAVVSWPADRPAPRTRQARELAGPTALCGAFWGLLFGLVFLLPLARRAGGDAPGLSAAGLPPPGVLDGVGLGEELLERIRDRIAPGSSALFLLTEDEVVPRLRRTFAETGAETGAEAIVARLSRVEELALRAGFDDGDGPVPTAVPGP